MQLNVFNLWEVYPTQFPKYFLHSQSMYPGNQTSLTNGYCCFKLESKEHVSLTVQLQFVCCWLLTGGTVTPVSLIAVVPTVLEKLPTVIY